MHLRPPRGFLFILTIGCLSCSPSDNTSRLADAYVDLLRYRETTTQPDTSGVRAGIDSILTHHGYTREAYEAAFASLANDSKALETFFGQVDQRVAATNPVRQPQP